MNNDSTKQPEPKGPAHYISTAFWVLLASIPLSAVLYGVAPLVAAVGGILGASWLVSKSEELSGRWAGMAFFCSFFGWPISMLVIGGAILLLLIAPAWLLAKVGFWKLD